MAAPSRTRRPRTRTSPGVRWRAVLLAEPVRRTIQHGLVIALIVGGVGFGLWRLDRWVSRHAALTAPAGPVALEWAALPAWLQLEQNQHILDDVEACAGLRADDRWEDEGLARRIALRLALPEVGWIRRLHRVAKLPPNRLVVDCEFRKPAAWVRYAGDDYLVDADGVRLPGRYRRTSVSGSGLVDINGVRQPPPDVGALWRGDDFLAALAVARLNESQPYGHQITGVAIEAGLRGAPGRAPVIELLTNRPGARICWGRPPGDEGAAEISYDAKISLLNALYRRYGRVDMDGGVVDITSWDDRVGVSESGGSDDSADVVGIRRG